MLFSARRERCHKLSNRSTSGENQRVLHSDLWELLEAPPSKKQKLETNPGPEFDLEREIFDKIDDSYNKEEHN